MIVKTDGLFATLLSNSNSANFQETEDERSPAVNSHFVLWCLGFLHSPCGT